MYSFFGIFGDWSYNQPVIEGAADTLRLFLSEHTCHYIPKPFKHIRIFRINKASYLLFSYVDEKAAGILNLNDFFTYGYSADCDMPSGMVAFLLAFCQPQVAVSFCNRILRLLLYELYNFLRLYKNRADVSGAVFAEIFYEKMNENLLNP